MPSIGDLVVKLKTDLTDFDKNLKKAQSRFDKTAKGFKTLGKQLTAGVTLPIVGIGAAIIKAGGDFEAGMNRLRGVLVASEVDFTALEEKAKQLGSTTMFSASEAAGGMLELSKAGLSADQTLGAIESTLQLAAAGGIELGDAAGIAAGVMNQFGLEAQEVGRISNVLAATARSSATDISLLQQSFKFGGKEASTFGLSLEQTGAAFGILARNAIAGSTAGERLRSILGKLANPSKDAEKALAKYGLTAADVDITTKDLASVLGVLQKASISAKDGIKIFGTEANAAAQSLIQAGEGGFNQFTEDLTGTTAAAAMADANMRGFQGAIKELKSAAEGLAIAIAQSGILEFFTGFVKRAAEIIQTLSQTNPAILQAGTVIAGLAALVGPLVLGLAGLASAVAAVGAPTVATVAGITAVTGAIAGLAAWVASNDSIVGPFRTAWDSVSGAVGEAVDSIVTFASTLVSKLKTFMALPEVQRIWKAAVDAIAVVWDTGIGLVVNALSGFFRTIKGIFDAGTALLEGDTQAFNDAIVGIFRGMVETSENAWKILWEALPSLVSAGQGLLVAAVQGVATAVATLWQSFIDGVKSAWSSMWEAIKQKVTDVKQNIVNAVTGVTDGIEQAWADLKNTLVGNSIVPDMMTDIQGVFTNSRTGIRDANDNILGDLQGGWQGIKDALIGEGGVVATMVQGVENMIGAVLGSITGPGGIKEAITGALGAMKDAVLDFVSDQVMGLMLKQLKQLIELGPDLGGLGDIFGSIFGTGSGGSSGGGGVGIPGPGNPTGSGGGVGGASGGGGSYLDFVNTIANAISAVANVVNVFQNLELETGIDAIALHTLRAENYLGSRADGGIIGVLFNHSDWLQFLVANSDEHKNTLWSIEGKLQILVNKMDSWHSHVTTGREQRDLLASIDSSLGGSGRSTASPGGGIVVDGPPDVASLVGIA